MMRYALATISTRSVARRPDYCGLSFRDIVNFYVQARLPNHCVVSLDEILNHYVQAGVEINWVMMTSEMDTV